MLISSSRATAPTERSPDVGLLAVGVFLTVVGACDLIRSDTDAASRPRLLATLGAGGLLLVGLLVWLAENATESVRLGVLLLVALGCWVAGSSGALAVGLPRRRATTLRAVAFAGLIGGLVVAVLGAGALEAWPLWAGGLSETAMARWPVVDVVVAIGAVLLQLATANIIVRLVLDAVVEMQRRLTSRTRATLRKGSPSPRLVKFGVAGQQTRTHQAPLT